MRSWLAVAAVIALGGAAHARPAVAIAGIEATGDSVGVDVESVGIARELTIALRRQASRSDSPLQLVDPVVVADDVEALIWGKLIRDADAFILTIHLSPVGSESDTVSFKATIKRTQTSSAELARWSKTIYKALLDQIDIGKGDDSVAAKRGKAAKKPAVPVAAAAPPVPTTEAEILATRDPGGSGGLVAVPQGDAPPAPVQVEEVKEADKPAPAPAEPAQFAPDRRLPPEPPPGAASRRAFWIAGGVAAAGVLLWTYSALQIEDAEDQAERLQGCNGCQEAIDAANAQGNRWEGVSYLAGTLTIGGIAAAALFGYQGYIAGRKPAPTELVGGRAARAVNVAPIIGRGRLGAGVTVTF